MTRIGGSDLSPAALATAIEANVVEYWRTCCSFLPGADFHHVPEVTWFVTNIAAAPWFNQVMLARFAPGQVDASIERTLALFEARSLPMLWSVTPSTLPPDQARYLSAHGLTLSSTMAGMAIDLATLSGEPSTPSNFTLKRVVASDTMEQWGDAYIHGFEMDDPPGRILCELYARIGFADDLPFRHYVGLLDGRPVASSTLFLGSATAGIWHVGTLPSVRQRGIGAALTLAPLREAASIGYRVGTLYASMMGMSVYRRLGFQEYCNVTQYQWRPSEGL